MDLGNIQSFRKQIKIIDATLRDGGLVNDFAFPQGFAKALFEADRAAGVDIMEVGYRASQKLFDPEKLGPWKFSREEDIAALVGEGKGDMKISVMADVGRTELDDIVPASQSVIDMYRIAAYVNQVPAATDMVELCHDRGYLTCCNIMAVSKVREGDLRRALEIIASGPVDVIYIVDSFGSLYPEEMRAMCDLYGEIAQKYGKQLGIHAHNNQQLAFANTVECVAKGVNFVDATAGGMGRGAGNCPLEALLGFLKNPRYRLEPILKFLREHIEPLKSAGVRWGYEVPYLLTGLNNVHPSAAINFIREGRDDYENLLHDILSGE